MCNSSNDNWSVWDRPQTNPGNVILVDARGSGPEPSHRGESYKMGERAKEEHVTGTKSSFVQTIAIRTTQEIHLEEHSLGCHGQQRDNLCFSSRLIETSSATTVMLVGVAACCGHAPERQWRIKFLAEIVPQHSLHDDSSCFLLLMIMRTTKKFPRRKRCHRHLVLLLPKHVSVKFFIAG